VLFEEDDGSEELFDDDSRMSPQYSHVSMPQPTSESRNISDNDYSATYRGTILFLILWFYELIIMSDNVNNYYTMC